MKQQLLKKQLIATAIILSLGTAPVMASSTLEDNDGSSEIIGFSTGAIIGGIIAGPIGIVAAGALGVIIGQSYDRQEKIELAEMHLEKNKLDIQSLSSEKEQLASRLSQTEHQQALLASQLSLTEKTLSQVEQLEQIKLNLRFEVNSSHVESFYEPQIKHLAMMMQETPELSVSLSGFTDASGSSDNNLKLSQDRTESVKTMLVAYGANEANIFTTALGESSATQISRTQQSDFNNRKVEVELISNEQLTVKVDDKQNEVTPIALNEKLIEDENLAENLTEITTLQTFAETYQEPTLAELN